MPPVAIATSASQSQGKPRSGQTWVVLVGVNHYRDLDLVSLKYAALDCAELQKVLEQTLQGSSQFLMHHDDYRMLPERGSVLDTFEKVKQNCQPQDTVLFYFSGHGIVDPNTQQVVLALADTHCSRLAESGIQIGELATWLEQCPAERQFVWLDACHSGTFQTNNDPVPQLIDSLRRCAERSRNFFALLSCDQGQRSWEFAELGHGIFTHSLLHGLQGAAADAQGRITADSLYQSIYQQTLSYIETLNRQNRLLNQQRSSRGTLLLPEYPQQTPKKIVEAVGEPIIGHCTQRPSVRHFSALLLDNGTIPRLSLPFAKLLWEQGNYEICYLKKGQLLSQYRQDQTLLLYLRGHLQDQLFIAEDGESYSQETLRSFLVSNASCQKLVILDCPTSTSCDCQNWIAALQSETSASCCLLACADFGFAAALFHTLENTKSLSVPEWIGRLQNQGLDLHFHLSGRQLLDILPRRAPYQGQQPKPDFDPGLCPYPGLQALDEETAPFFFGREALVVQLLERIEHQAFIAVIGTSGSGKSSLVRAGLIAQLRQGKKISGSQNWWLKTVRLGSSPLVALSQGLSAAPLLSPEDFVSWIDLRSEPLVVLVIDQFEELFTLGSREEQKQVLAMLLAGLNQAKNRFRLVVTLRVDCLSLCLEWPELASRLQSDTLLVPPYLSKEQYREAIEQPAELMGIHVEPELRDVLLNELSGSIGELPLLAFVLQQLWETRRGSMLTLASFQQELGGLQGALESHAENVMASLGSDARACARWIFLSLVQLCDSTEDTRRQIPRDRLTSQQFDSTLVTTTLETLVANKLLVLDEKTVEIAHEVLIRKWPTLRQWLAESRASLIEQRQIEDEATRWKERGQRPAELLRDDRLSEVEKYYKVYRDRLSQTEISLIEASIKQKDQELQIASKRANQTRIAAIVFGVLAFLAFFLAGSTYWQGLKGQERQVETLVKSAELQMVSHQQLDALTDSLKAEYLLRQTWTSPSSLQESVRNTLQKAYYTTQQFNRLEGHTDAISQLRFSPDGKTIASASWDHNIRLWRSDGTPLLILSGHTSWVMGIDFSPDGQTLVSGSSDGTIRLWNVSDGRLLHTLKGNGGQVFSVQFSPDGQLIVSAHEDGSVRLWKQLILLQVLKGHIGEVTSVRFSPNGKFIASAGWDGSLRIWQRNGKLLHTLRKGKQELWSVVFNPQGDTVATTSEGSNINLWTLDGQWIRSLPKETTQPFINISFSPDGQEISAACGDGNIYLWSTDGTPISRLQGHILQVNTVSYSPDGVILASGGNDKTILLWKLKQATHLVHTAHKFRVNALSFSNDGKILATGSEERTIRFWNRNGELQKSLEIPGGALALAFSPKEKVLAAGGNARRIYFWSYSGKLLKIFKPQNSAIIRLDFSSDGRYLVANGADTSIWIWDLNNGSVRLIKAPGKQIGAVHFMPDRKTLVVADEKNLYLINTKGKVLKKLGGHLGIILDMCVSSDGKIIASSSLDNTVRLWRPDGSLLKTLLIKNDRVINLSFSPNGNLLVGGTSEKAIYFWDRNGNLLTTLFGHKDAVFRVLFSPDSKILASGGNLGDLHFWYNWQSEQTWLVKQSCSLLNPFLRVSKTNSENILTCQ